MKTSDPLALLQEATRAMSRAYCPYSHFAVGAALLTDDGVVFSGCNVENGSYGLTVCAERSALFAAVAAGHRQFSALAVVADHSTLPYPCGACRQVLAEFGNPKLAVYVARASDLEHFSTFELGQLLPNTFQLKPPNE